MIKVRFHKADGTLDKEVEAKAGQRLLDQRIAATREVLERAPDERWSIELFTTDNTDPMMSGMNGMANNGFGQTNPYSYPY